MRIEQDSLHNASSTRTDEMSAMKKECASVRKLLREYAQGRLFPIQKSRIKRHLKSCLVCSSEYQALEMENETRRILKDINSPDSLLRRLREGLPGLADLKKFSYWPVWLAIVGIVALAVISMTSHQRDIEIENLEKSLPPVRMSATAPVATASTATHASLPEQPAPVQPAAAPVSAPAPPASVIEPLIITITPENDQAMQRINEIMQGHGSLRNMRFSEAVKEISGNLTARELLTFFNRLESVGKVSYSRRRFESLPAEQPVPFVLRLKPAPKIVEQPIKPSTPSGAISPETTAQPASAPSRTTLP